MVSPTNTDQIRYSCNQISQVTYSLQYFSSIDASLGKHTSWVAIRKNLTYEQFRGIKKKISLSDSYSDEKLEANGDFVSRRKSEGNFQREYWLLNLRSTVINFQIPELRQNVEETMAFQVRFPTGKCPKRQRSREKQCTLWKQSVLDQYLTIRETAPMKYLMLLFGQLIPKLGFNSKSVDEIFHILLGSHHRVKGGDNPQILFSLTLKSEL